jgi:hypothetical protein
VVRPVRPLRLEDDDFVLIEREVVTPTPRQLAPLLKRVAASVSCAATLRHLASGAKNNSLAPRSKWRPAKSNSSVRGGARVFILDLERRR